MDRGITNVAAQTVDTIIVNDPTNPTELQTWFTNHPLAVITSISLYGNIFVIVHT